MKSLFSIVAVFSLALVSCTERIPEKEMPNVDNGVITMIKATVEPLELKGAKGVGNYSWSEGQLLGIYGSETGENERYTPVKTTVGDSEAYFYGNSVGGDLKVYMPYLEGGSAAANDYRVPVPAKQQYYADAFEHLMYNSAFFATTTSNEVKFDYVAGLVKVELKYDIQDITSVAVKVGNITTDAGYSDHVAGDVVAEDDGAEEFVKNGVGTVVVDGFPEGVDTTIANPLVVWVAVAPGEYENLVVEISNVDGTLSSPVRGPFVVEAKAIAEQVCTAEEVKLDNGIGDFEGENGEFNPKN